MNSFSEDTNIFFNQNSCCASCNRLNGYNSGSVILFNNKETCSIYARIEALIQAALQPQMRDRMSFVIDLYLSAIVDPVNGI